MFCDVELCGSGIGRSQDEHLYLYGSGYHDYCVHTDFIRTADMDFSTWYAVGYDRVIPVGILPKRQKENESRLNRFFDRKA